MGLSKDIQYNIVAQETSNLKMSNLKVRKNCLPGACPIKTSAVPRGVGVYQLPTFADMKGVVVFSVYFGSFVA